tara:strand:- start:9 stop:143 length:135 start_codon:yes stop_codon:yes gene_type:complete
MEPPRQQREDKVGHAKGNEPASPQLLRLFVNQLCSEPEAQAHWN